MSPDRSRVRLTASGLPDTVIEIGQQLLWVSGALRSPDSSSGALLRPCVRRTTKKEQTETSITLEIQLCCQEQLLTEPPQQQNSRGNCWRDLFRTPIIVQGFPTLRRLEPSLGLEIDLATMALLACGHRIITFNGYLLIKGYRTMLVAIKAVEGIILWHVLTKEEGDDIEYYDPRVPQLKPQIDATMSWSQLKNMRHVVGWCSRIKDDIGKLEVPIS